MTETTDCVFCEIVAGRSPASVPFEDELVICVMDVRPVNPGHLLVIPKRHVEGLDGLGEETGVHMFRIGLRMQQAIRASSLPCEGINFLLSDGESAGQDVSHVHLHVVPRLANDRFRISAAVTQPAQDELDRSAAAIRTAS